MDTNAQQIIDLEEFAKDGKQVPKNKTYKIRVDRDKYLTNEESLTGRQILELAGKIPYSRFQLNQKVKGAVRKVGYEERVDFTAPGVERFMTLPLDQTEG